MEAAMIGFVVGLLGCFATVFAALWQIRYVKESAGRQLEEQRKQFLAANEATERQLEFKKKELMLPEDQAKRLQDQLDHERKEVDLERQRGHAERLNVVAVDLHRKFNTPLMLVCRSAGVDLVLEKPERTFDVLLKEELPKKAANVWVVGAFFQRLVLAIKYSQVDEKLIPDLFGDVFIWWYDCCYETHLQPTGWES
jgi:hypothetical protein